MSRIIFHILLITMFIAGCGRLTTRGPLTPEAHPSNLPALTGEWTINMAHSGGIMGLSRSIKISSDAKFTVVDDRADKTISGELSDDEISQIKKIVSSSKYTAPALPDGMACADCFIYDLEIDAHGEKFSVQLNDISLPDSGLDSFIAYLRGLIDIAVK